MIIDTKTNKEISFNDNVDLLTRTINEILNTVPDEWENITIAIVSKPGDDKDCNNLRGVRVIAHIGKVLDRVKNIQYTRRLSTYGKEQLVNVILVYSTHTILITFYTQL